MPGSCLEFLVKVLEFSGAFQNFLLQIFIEFRKFLGVLIPLFQNIFNVTSHGIEGISHILNLSNIHLNIRPGSELSGGKLTGDRG